ncbi:MAG: IclR family transcriptional regulator [Rhodospirillales bacterium]
MVDNAEPVVIKAFAVIEVILAAGRPLSLPELAEALERPKQTVHRTARQLEDHGFLFREPTRDRYAIGPKLYNIAKDVMGWCTRYTPRNAVLARLVAEVSETCNIGILDGDSVLYLDRVESNFPLRAELHPGSRVPVHCTGLGKLFLAHLPSRTRKRILERVALEKYTAQTLTSAEALEADCAQIRAHGYSVNNEEFHDGIISVAVPVHADADHVISGLAIHAPAARMSVEDAVALVPILKKYARQIASDLVAESG